MTGTELIVTTEPEVALDALARRYRQASGPGMRVLGLVGGQAENLLERLPDTIKDRLEAATEAALRAALNAAARSRGGRLPDGTARQTTIAAATMGAAGGFGGLPTALAELPITTTVLMRAIQGIATQYGFDPADDDVQAECLQVFAAAGPLMRDDAADLGFLTARVTLTGPAVHGMIARVAPRLAAALGQKLAAQTVPVLGAMSGAAINMIFARYYQEMAHIRFGLKALARDSGRPQADLIEALRDRMQPRLRNKGTAA